MLLQDPTSSYTGLDEAKDVSGTSSSARNFPSFAGSSMSRKKGSLVTFSCLHLQLEVIGVNDVNSGGRVHGQL